MSNRAFLKWGVLAVALVLLNGSLTFDNVWPTLAVQLTAAVSIEALLFILAFVLLRRRLGPPSRGVLRLLGIVWVILALGRYVDVTTRSLYGRDINLYWDLRYVPDVSAMLAYVAEPWMIVGIVLGAVLLPVAAYGVLRWALGSVSDAAEDPRARAVLTAAAALGLLIAAAPQLDARVPTVLPVAEPITVAFARQAGQLAYEASGAGIRRLPPAPRLESNLAHVRGADVLLVFIESYGVVSWDRPSLARALVPSRTRLEADIRATGRSVVSTRVESTTFGGESWLAHISLLTGTEVRDQDTNVRLMTQQRDTLFQVFARGGYRTATLMPGLQRAWPEGGFYRSDAVYGAGELRYQGPPFGWWDVTDQYALARMDELVAASGASDRPLFVFFPTISTHTPFTPTPPYQPDWRRILTPQPYDTAELDRAWSEPPDWLNLSPGYAKAVAYTYATLGGYLRAHAKRDMVMILIGDHQPPAAVSGEDASWDVPVHIIASRPELLDRLRERGFQDGLAPPAGTLTKIHQLLPILLGAFGDS